MLRSRRWRIPKPSPSADGNEARRAVSEAVHRLGDALSRQREVDETAARLERVHRENRLAPRIAAALGAHHD